LAFPAFPVFNPHRRQQERKEKGCQHRIRPSRSSGGEENRRGARLDKQMGGEGTGTPDLGGERRRSEESGGSAPMTVARLGFVEARRCARGEQKRRFTGESSGE